MVIRWVRVLFLASLAQKILCSGPEEGKGAKSETVIEKSDGESDHTLILLESPKNDVLKLIGGKASDKGSSLQNYLNKIDALLKAEEEYEEKKEENEGFPSVETTTERYRRDETTTATFETDGSSTTKGISEPEKNAAPFPAEGKALILSVHPSECSSLKLLGGNGDGRVFLDPDGGVSPPPTFAAEPGAALNVTCLTRAPHEWRSTAKDFQPENQITVTPVAFDLLCLSIDLVVARKPFSLLIFNFIVVVQQPGTTKSLLARDVARRPRAALPRASACKPYLPFSLRVETHQCLLLECRRLHLRHRGRGQGGLLPLRGRPLQPNAPLRFSAHGGVCLSGATHGDPL